MRIATLNIRHGGGKRINTLLETILAMQADIVVVTEFRENANAQTLRDALHHQGYPYTASNPTLPKHNSVLIASREPFTRVPLRHLDEAHQHRLVAIRFEALDLIGCYFPLNKAKQPVFDFILEHLASQASPHSLIVGDMNTGLPYLGKRLINPILSRPAPCDTMATSSPSRRSRGRWSPASESRTGKPTSSASSRVA